MKLHNAMIYVKDLPRMCAFYAELLRRRPINTEHTDTWALFDTGGVEFALHAIRSDGDETRTPTPAKPRETSPVKLTFVVDDVHKERARLERMGALLIQRPWQKPDEACDSVDPEGNIFQIVAAALRPKT